ncbi:MAG TPA: hypothetical protein ENK65_01465 [Helicobacteraceae bacterium]|nr:hypothetical protein [Helicobacteraceae bacterium]
MIKIEGINNGISATLTGFKKEDIASKIEACQAGACECACDPAVMSKIEDIQITDSDNDTNITVIGDLDVKTIAPMMQACLIDDTQNK